MEEILFRHEILRFVIASVFRQCQSFYIISTEEQYPKP